MTYPITDLWAVAIALWQVVSAMGEGSPIVYYSLQFLLLSDRLFLRCYASRTGDHAADTKGEVVSNHPDGKGEGHGDHVTNTYAAFPPLPYRLLGC